MGGKRPDQYNIDPAEGSSTDHKWRHEGRSADEHLANREKQLERQTEVEDMRRAMNTKQHDAKRDQTPAKGAGDRAQDRADERVDEASEESFPASDPPRQP